MLTTLLPMSVTDVGTLETSPSFQTDMVVALAIVEVPGVCNCLAFQAIMTIYSACRLCKAYQFRS